jgi:putative spermidine/putrescine transport system permease protein
MMRKLVGVFTALVAVFLMGPIFVVVPIAFSSSSYMEFPPPGFSLRWFEAFFTSREWADATMTSLNVAAATVVAATVLGTLAALGLRRLRGRWASLLTGLLAFPLMVPLIAYALGLYLVYAVFGLNGTIPGLVLAHTALALPYVVINISAPLSTMDETQEKAARSLGANQIKTFFTVVLPHIYPGVLAGALFAFLASFDEVIVAIFVSGITTKTLPVMMWESVRTDLDPTIAAVATMLIVLTLVSLGLAAALQSIAAKRSLKV